MLEKFVVHVKTVWIIAAYKWMLRPYASVWLQAFIVEINVSRSPISVQAKIALHSDFDKLYVAECEIPELASRHLASNACIPM